MSILSTKEICALGMITIKKVTDIKSWQMNTDCLLEVFKR